MAGSGYIFVHSLQDVNQKMGGIRVDQISAYFPNTKDVNGGSLIFMAATNTFFEVTESCPQIENMISEAS